MIVPRRSATVMEPPGGSPRSRRSSVSHCKSMLRRHQPTALARPATSLCQPAGITAVDVLDFPPLRAMARVKGNAQDREEPRLRCASSSSRSFRGRVQASAPSTRSAGPSTSSQVLPRCDNQKRHQSGADHDGRLEHRFAAPTFGCQLGRCRAGTALCRLPRGPRHRSRPTEPEPRRTVALAIYQA
jgi:hypothetical protein